MKTNASLRECDNGDFEGLTSAQMASDHAEFLRPWQKRPADTPPPGAEAPNVLQILA